MTATAVAQKILCNEMWRSAPLGAWPRFHTLRTVPRSLSRHIRLSIWSITPRDSNAPPFLKARLSYGMCYGFHLTLTYWIAKMLGVGVREACSFPDTRMLQRERDCACGVATGEVGDTRRGGATWSRSCLRILWKQGKGAPQAGTGSLRWRKMVFSLPECSSKEQPATGHCQSSRSESPSGDLLLDQAQRAGASGSHWHRF